jgi:RNA polymerase sigma-70 factor (ECF subfamily)
METASAKVDDMIEAGSSKLIPASRVGDGHAYRKLYERHVGAVYTFLRWMCGNVAEAEELTQDVFVRAWENLDRFEGRSSLSTWLARIAINAYRERRRSFARWNRGRVDYLEASEIASGDGSCPRETLMDLERAIRSLPRRARTVLVLAEIGGYRHAEIASMMGISVGASKAQLNRAKRLLRREVEP